VNASSGRHLGLDDARADQDGQTKALFDELIAKWGLDRVLPLLESTVGSPPRVRLRRSTGPDIVTDFNDLFLVNFALSFSQHFTLRQTSAPILEIGGGYGRTVAKLARVDPDVRFLLLDLPPAGLLQAFYLNELFPGEVSVMPISSHRAATLPDGRFVICDPQALNWNTLQLSGVINTRSFGEMERSVVARYFHLIQHSLVAEGIFLNVNRLQKIGYRFTQYPYDGHWDVVESGAAFAQDGLWHLTTRRRNSINPTFWSWTQAVPRQDMPSPVRRLLSQVRRIL